VRTDATIDRRQVRLPNASTLGYGKWKAQVGDLVVFKETEHHYSHGRMIGRVHYASGHDGQPIRDYILVIVLNETLDHTYERWVNPKDVVSCYTLQTENTDRRKVCEYFLSDELVKSPIDEIRRSTEYGSATVYKYRKAMAQRKAEQEDFERRHKDCDTVPCDFCQKFKLHGASVVNEVSK